MDDQEASISPHQIFFAALATSITRGSSTPETNISNIPVPVEDFSSSEVTHLASSSLGDLKHVYPEERSPQQHVSEKPPPIPPPTTLYIDLNRPPVAVERKEESDGIYFNTSEERRLDDSMVIIYNDSRRSLERVMKSAVVERHSFIDLCTQPTTPKDETLGQVNVFKLVVRDLRSDAESIEERAHGIEDTYENARRQLSDILASVDHPRFFADRESRKKVRDGQRSFEEGVKKLNDEFHLCDIYAVHLAAEALIELPEGRVD